MLNSTLTSASVATRRRTDSIISCLLVALAIGVAVLASPGQAEVLTRTPYTQMGTSTEMVIRWRTDVAADSRVLYGTELGSLTLIAEESSLTTEHEVQITGLLPDTKYFYSVGNSTLALAGNDADHFFITAPLVGVQAPTRVLVLGDSGGYFQDAAEVRDAYHGYAGANPADLWLMLGDNAYLNGTDAEYQAGLFDMFPQLLRTSVLWPGRGNHDLIYSGPNNDYYDHFTMPTAGEAGGLASGTEAYYSFDYANIHFVSLDSQGSSRAPAGAMLTWLAADLAATSQDWIVAFFHHAPYSKGTHDSDSSNSPKMTDMRENALPVLEAGGVDLVLAAHSHAYERSMLIDGHYSDSSTYNSSMTIDGGDGKTDGDGPYRKATLGPSPHEGTVYTTFGSSSWLQAGGSLNHPAMISNVFALGFILLDVDANRLKATFVDETMTERDYFTIIKATTGVPVAILSATPDTGMAPLPVSFDGTASFDSEEDPLTYAWDFGDGNVGSGATANHTYTTPGNYTVTLTVDDGLLQDSAQTTVSALNEISEDGLIAHWKLDETDGAIASDSIGLNDGTLLNGPGWQPAGGTIAGALEFDGVDDLVDLGTLDIDSGTGLTLSMWVKVDDLDVGDSRLISKANGTSGSNHYWMLSSLSGNSLRFRLKTDGTTSTLVSASGALPTGVWVHVGATYDGTTMRLYKDGLEIASLATTGTIDTNPVVSAAIGNQPVGAGSRPFDGLIDEVRIYNRALTGLEITALSNPEANQPPTASFTATPASGSYPLLVDFDGTGSTDPEDDALSYAWDFGDGNNGSGAEISHTYTAQGVYTATLTVDDGQALDSSDQTITVNGALDTDSDEVPDVDDNCPVTGNAGQEDRNDDGIGDACQCGDVNGDGAANNDDVTEILLVLWGYQAYTQPGNNWAICDVTADGECDNDDVTAILLTLWGYDAYNPPTVRWSCQEDSNFPPGLVIDPPIARDDGYATDEDTTLVVPALTGVLANDEDRSPPDSLTALLVSSPTNGTLTNFESDGSFSYVPVANFSGVDGFTYEAVDGSTGISTQATVVLTVDPVNDAPIAGDDSYETPLDTVLVVNVASGVLDDDTDQELDALQSILVDDVGNGVLNLNPDGSFQYTPSAGFSAQDSFTYRANDTALNSNLATVTISVGTDNSQPYIVTGSIAFTKQVVDDTLGDAHAVTAADFTGDGELDLVATDYLDGMVFWYENDGSGGYITRVLDADLAGAYPLAIGKVNADAQPDLLAGGYNADTFVWYESNGSGGFTRHDIDTASDGAHSIVSGDMDDDGDFDLLTSSQDANSIAWYENDGANNFVRHLIDGSALAAKRAEFGDMDGDGDMDVVTAAWDNHEIAWHENDGSENFTKRSIGLGVVGAYYAFPADIDGDGDLDVFSASQIDSTIAWYRNDAALGFAYQEISSVSSGARGVIGADIDGDGDVDAIATSVDDDTVAWYENDGSGGFYGRVVDVGADGAYGAFTVDINFDGLLDILSASRDAQELAIHRQMRAHTATIDLGASLVIDSTLLRAEDTDDGATQLTYALTTVPGSGSLQVSGVPVGLGDTFTQQDINSGLLSYVDDGIDDSQDHFDFTVADGGESGTKPVIGRFSVSITRFNGSVVRLPLDEGSGSLAGDVSGEGNDGTLTDGAVFEASTGDGSAFAVRFDGVDDYIDLGGVDVSGTGLTLAAQFNPDTISGSHRLISKASGSTANEHVFMLGTTRVGSADRLRARVRHAGLTATVIASSGDLVEGVWQHAALTFDGSRLRLYLDGVEVGSAPFFGAVDTDPAIPVAVGAQPPGAGGGYFDGLIDDVRILSRGMSAAEVVQAAAGAD